MRPTLTDLALTLLAAAFFLGATVALSFPENVRADYPACSTCHVAPTGGGVLTNYGRGAGAALLSTWSKEGEELPFYSMPANDYVLVGADARYVNVTSRSVDGLAHLGFVMQDEGELALKPVEALSFVGTVGKYGPDGKREFRRNYVKADLPYGVALRAGRFIPAYGIAFPDHTLPTREDLGLGEGQESYCGEASIVNQLGELIVTGVVGGNGNVTLNQGSGYALSSDQYSGVTARASAFVLGSLQVGASYMGLSAVEHTRQAYGMHVMGGYWGAYFLAEYDRRFADGAVVDLGAAKLGYEIFRGVHFSLLADGVARQRSLGGQLQLFPRPHFELVGEYRRAYSMDEPETFTDSVVVMLHHYL